MDGLSLTKIIVILIVVQMYCSKADTFSFSHEGVVEFSKTINKIEKKFPVINNRPIIGILAQESDGYKKDYGETYFYASYAKFVEGGGARAAPVRVGEDDQYYDELFSQINGIILPGGMVDPIKSMYAQVARKAMAYSIAAYKKGDYFPVLGICLGFETLAVNLVDQNVLSDVDAENLALPLDFSHDYRNSRIFANLPLSLYQSLKSENITANAHHFGLLPSVFNRFSEMQDFFKILSTNKDRNGREFISTIEAYRYPIYGLQFHPEKNTYSWYLKYSWSHTPNAILVTQYFADFFVTECRRNLHKFSSLNTEFLHTVDSILPFILPPDVYPFEQIYAFNFTKSMH